MVHPTTSAFLVEDINHEDVYEGVVDVANVIGVTVFRQSISLFHRLPSRDPGSRPINSKVIRPETKLPAITHKRNLKSSSNKLF